MITLQHLHFGIRSSNLITNQVLRLSSLVAFIAVSITKSFNLFSSRAASTMNQPRPLTKRPSKVDPSNKMMRIRGDKLGRLWSSSIALEKYGNPNCKLNFQKEDLEVDLLVPRALSLLTSSRISYMCLILLKIGWTRSLFALQNNGWHGCLPKRWIFSCPLGFAQLSHGPRSRSTT